jgi:transposase
MSLLAKYLPRPTSLDPAEDPPSSIDPLGTLGPAERIAEVLFPAFTARMWRPRFLTFAAMASLVAEHVTRTVDGQGDGSLAARLGFERLFVSAVVRQQVREPEKWRSATRRLPGNQLARKALHSGDTPLARNNFLKGQAINGPFGVIGRLARHLGIVDEDDRLGRGGEELLLAWSADEKLPGLLDAGRSGSTGRQWLDSYIQATAAHVANRCWRSSGWSGWQDLAKRQRPDKIGRQERRVLRRLLDADSIRARSLELLREPQVVALYRASRDNDSRSDQERSALLNGVLPLLLVEEREEDRVIDLTIRLADAYEQVASLLEAAFNGLLWGLTRRSGQAKPGELQADRQLQPVFQSVCRQLPRSTRLLRELVERIPTIPQVGDLNPIEPLDTLISEALTAAEGPSQLVGVLISRHRNVQNAKSKGMWIEPGERWTLMPGFGLATDGPPQPEIAYPHTFRVPNAYSFLGELGLSGVEVTNEEA